MSEEQIKGVFPKGVTEIEVVEKHVIKRVTIGNFISNILDAFNMTRGGIYTLKKILINPGQVVRDYLGASRPRLMAPFKMLIFSTALVLLLINAFNLFEYFVDNSINIEGESAPELRSGIIEILINYFNLILWTYVPIAALLSYLFNRKRGFNYAENLVLQAYILSLTNIVVILCFPISYLSVDALIVVSQLLIGAYMVYTYKVFFQKKWSRSIFETFVIFFVASLLWFIILGVVILLITVLKAP